MRLFNLLAMGMIVCSGVTAQAQTVFQQDFSAEQTAQPTDPAYYEFINLQKDADGNLVDKWTVADGVLTMENSADFPCTNQTWQRAIKFRNLPLKEKTLYKISFDIDPQDTPVDEETFTNIPGYVDVKLMQGDENADICIIDAAGAEQRANITLNAGEKQTITKTFYFADLVKQNEKYEANCAGKELYSPEKFFAGINVYAPGKYVVDNFVLEEASPLEKIEFNAFNIRMGYVGATNANALLNGATRKVYDASLATVKVNDKEVAVDDVELQKDGLYIFTVDEIPGDAKVEVSLNAPEEVQLAGGFAGLSLNCENVLAQFSDDAVLAAAMPFSFAPAEIVKTTPAEGSFALPTTIENFTFEFDHDIDASSMVAELSNGTTLQVVGVDGKVVTLAGGEFPKGAYTITLKNVLTSNGTPTEVDPTLSFETGEIQLAHTDYKLVLDGKTQLEAEGGIPTGWTLALGVDADGNPKLHNGGQNSRGFLYTNSNVQSAFYLRDWEGAPVVATSSPVTIPAGDVEFRALTAGWGATGVLNYKLTDANGEVVVDKDITVSTVLEKNRQGMFQTDAVRFTSNGGEYTCIIELKSGNELLAGGFEVYSYEETPGDKFEAEEVFNSHFTGANMPAEGSGWLVYENNNPLAPGSGRNGTSGVLERNFHQKMQSAAFFRECGDNPDAAMRLEYGNGNGVDNGFHMDPGKYELTYYAGTWNDPAGNAAGNSKVFMDLIDVATGAVVYHSEHVNVANFQNGGACNGQADKVVEKVSTSGGNFIVRLWGTTNTVLGSLSITKEGSLAAKWYSNLAEAVEEAEVELAASESERLDGTAKTTLSDAIGKYKKPSGMYTEGEFKNAIQELVDAQADMKARRDAMSTYDSVIGNIAGAIESAQEKYKVLDSYKVLVDINEQYGATDPTTLENVELVPLAASLKANYDTYTFMSSTGVNLLTKQIQDLKTAIMNMEGYTAYADILEKADAAVSDDQDLATLLKLVYTKLIYDACAGEGNPFIDMDPDLLIESPKPMEAAGFIQNANCYCTQPVQNGNTAVDANAFPGWNIEIKQGGLRSAWTTTWGENFPTAEKPIADCGVKSGWGDAEYNVEQILANLPVGIYTFSVQMGEDGIPGSRVNTEIEEVKSFAYVGDKKLTYDGELQEDGTVKCSRDFNSEANTKTFEGVEPVVAEGSVLGTMTIGVNMNLKGTHGGLDNFKLQMTAKKEGFDYEAAAAEVQKKIDELRGAGIKGDVNSDNTVDAEDLSIVISVMRGQAENPKADINGDKAVDAEDISTIISIMRGIE